MSNVWEIRHRHGNIFPILDALALQEHLFERKMSDDDAPSFMILAEHASIYACNRRDLEKLDTLFRVSTPSEKIIALAQRRGGSIIYHGPGQLVCYIVINLKDFGIGSRKLTTTIDEAVIKAISKFGIKGRLKPAELPVAASGVWVTMENGVQKKIASRGMHISRGITRFGFALNVNTDLSYFDAIYPCGLDIQMTSMQQETGHRQNMVDVAYALQDALLSKFDELYAAKQQKDISTSSA